VSVSVLSIADAHMLRLAIRVPEGDWVGFDRLEVWRSVLGEGGPYAELSAPSWQPATLPVNAGFRGALAGARVHLLGKSLKMRVNGQFLVTIVFTGSDPLTFATAAAQVTAGSQGHVTAYVDNLGTFVVQSQPLGGLASLEILGGDAAPLLNLPLLAPDNLAFGHDPRIPHTLGMVQYSFQDYYSEDAYFYKTRFSNSLTGARSGFSQAFGAERRVGVTPERLVLGFVKLARSDGRPAERQEVTVFNNFLARSLEGFTIVGAPEVFLTDGNGYVEFPLIRGIQVDIGVGGTSLVRRVNVPLDPTVLSFDVFDPQYGSNDNFSVQRAELPYADRKTLLCTIPSRSGCTTASCSPGYSPWATSSVVSWRGATAPGQRSARSVFKKETHELLRVRERHGDRPCDRRTPRGRGHEGPESRWPSHLQSGHHGREWDRQPSSSGPGGLPGSFLPLRGLVRGRTPARRP